MKKKKSRVTLRGLKTHTVKYGAAINKSLNTLICNIDSLVKALDHQKKVRPKYCIIVPLSYNKPCIWMAKIIDLSIDPFPGFEIRFGFARLVVERISYNLNCKMFECIMSRHCFDTEKQFDEAMQYLPREGWYIYLNEAKPSKIPNKEQANFTLPLGD